MTEIGLGQKRIINIRSCVSSSSQPTELGFRDIVQLTDRVELKEFYR